MIPNLRHLHVCQEVSRLGTLSAVARAVHLSQPAVTQAVANVERHFGCPLFTRASTGMKLTAAGEVCVPRIVRALAQLRDGLAELLRRNGRTAQDAPRILLRLTSAQLTALAAFTEHGSFTRAARAGGFAEPTIQRAARALESVLDVRLFEQTSFGLRPTRDAEALSRRIRLAYTEVEQARSDVDALHGSATGTTVIGAMPLARSFILPTALIAFAREHPEHQASIVEGTYEHLLTALQSGEADFLIGALRDGRVATDVRQEHLFDDPLSIAARAAHPLAGRKRLRAADLAAYPWIAPRLSSPLHAHFEALFAGAGVKPPPHPVQCNSLIAARAFLLEGDYLMLSSEQQIYYELRAGLLVALPHPRGRVMRSIGLTMRRNWQPTRAQDRLIELLRERARRAAAERSPPANS